ncbi:DUF1735 and LamG domain-containing protein [Bacteroides sp. OttesenSCG-928-M17]|nr:DUF1735 and LamG domain-containing protein [Bacteroides sp. OttesenSCG-928-M17]
MKTKYTLLTIVILSMLFSCKNADDFQDVIFFTGTEKSAVAKFTIDGPSNMGISVSASGKVESDVSIQVKPAPELVENFNKVNGKQYKPLPEGSYDLSTNEIIISKGQHVSDQIRLSINSLDSFEEGVTYCLPITIINSNGNMPVLEASRTLYAVISRTIITYAASINGIYFKVPFSNDQNLSSVPNVTMEARVFVNAFQEYNPFISTLMGIEENFLLRFGDVTIDKEQLQLAGGKYPLTSTINFETGTWYHVALVYNGSTLKLYINGTLNATTDAPRGNINLADTQAGGFHIGYSAGGRLLNGVVSEIRVWTKALSEVDIQNNICFVDPTTTGLLAYWRFNEGAGNEVKDWTGNGYDIQPAKGSISWVEGVRCPE